MTNYLCLSIRFLLSTSHGRGEDGEPEWPPSPLRLFQTLTAAAAARWNEREEVVTAAPALRWLEQQSVERIVASPVCIAETAYRSYVPDNTADLAAGSWARGDTSKIVKRTEKDIRRIYPRDDAVVHYLYPLQADCPHLDVLQQAARSVTHFGWGIDAAIGNAELMAGDRLPQLTGESWLPTGQFSELVLRVPCSTTLDNLARKHRAFLQRIGRDAKGNESFRPVPPLTAFRTVNYRRADQPLSVPYAAFTILRPEGTGMRPFHQVRQTAFVAERLRAAAAQAAEAQWNQEKISRFIMGHGETRGEDHQTVGAARFAFLPLPTLEYRGSEFAGVRAIRRAMVVCFDPAHTSEVRWAKRALAGTALTTEQREIAWLSALPDSDAQIQHYLSPSSVWSTVTPVILPGLNQRGGKVGSDGRRQFTGTQLRKQEEKTIRLLRRSLLDAGYEPKLCEQADIRVSQVGFLPGLGLASQYEVRERLRRYPRMHVQIQWRDAEGQPLKMPGPLCVGRGRYFGLGLFVGLPTAERHSR